MSALSGFLTPALDAQHHGSLPAGTGAPLLDSCPFGVAPGLFERQEWSTLLAAALSIPAHGKLGVDLHFAAVAALAGVDDVFSIGSGGRFAGISAGLKPLLP
jgi:hypothetical protein